MLRYILILVYFSGSAESTVIPKYFFWERRHIWKAF